MKLKKLALIAGLGLTACGSTKIQNMCNSIEEIYPLEPDGTGLTIANPLGDKKFKVIFNKEREKVINLGIVDFESDKELTFYADFNGDEKVDQIQKGYYKSENGIVTEFYGEDVEIKRKERKEFKNKIEKITKILEIMEEAHPRIIEEKPLKKI